MLDAATKNLDSELGALIRMHRVSKGMSPGDLARKANCSIAKLDAFETGRERVCVTSLMTICKALDLMPSQVLEHLQERLALREVDNNAANSAAVEFMASNRGRQFIRLLSNCDDDRFLSALADLVVSACMTKDHVRMRRPELAGSSRKAK